MNKPTWILLALFLILLLTGAVWAQIGEPPSFEPIAEIGQPSPQGIHYDSNFDRFAWVDRTGRLLLVDAATYQVQHVLYETGSYSGYQFSHNGRWLALAIEKRVEIWDTQIGTLVQSFQPDSALGITSLLQFSDDDTLLLLTAIVPAPDSIRRSETDTSQTPWLWELAAERGERRSILPLQRIQQPFFDLRNGLLLTPNDRLFTAFSGSVQLMDIAEDSYPPLTTVPSNRFERDPIDVWYGEGGEHLYYRAQNSSTIQQFRTDNADVIDINTGQEKNAAGIAPYADLALTDFSRIVGEPMSLQTNSFLSLLLGEDYRQQYNNHPLTVMVIDVLQPVTVLPNQMGLLVYIFDETTGRGVFEFVRPFDIVSMAVHPDHRHLLVRRASGVQPLEVYDMATGNLTLSIVPALPDFNGEQILAYDSSGETIISGFQRFDAQTGELLNEDLSYQTGFDQWFFTDDSRELVTLTGSNWQLWDIETEQVIRKETVRLRGMLLETANNAQRFLTRSDDGLTYEIVEVGTEERLSVTFGTLPERQVEQVYYSPDWQNYLVVYTGNSYYQHAPGNEIALYNIHDGLRWFIAGTDLPALDGRSYGWLDNETIYITAVSSDFDRENARIYGLEYDHSGLPACLVEAFPTEWTQWSDLWEQLTYRLRATSLGSLTQRLCAALPGSVEDVNAVFFPTATATRPYATSTPAIVAGIPACLTRTFSADARDYADDWRAMTAGLSPEEVAEVERLLCEGLGDAAGIGYVFEPVEIVSNLQVMLIDADTGARSLGTVLPPSTNKPRLLQPVLDEFRETEGVVADTGVLSPDNTLFAVRTLSGTISIQRLVRPYEDLLADITATAMVFQTSQPNVVSLAPTATQPFVELGLPQPTLTPTVTPTSPPPPQATVTQSAYGQIEELCPSKTIYSISQPPPDFAPSGRLLARQGSDSATWVYSVTDGGGYRDVTLFTRGQLSPDQQWQLIMEDRIMVARMDGSDAVTLFEPFEQAVFPQNIYWLDNHTIVYVYQGYVPEDSLNTVALMRRYDVLTGEFSEPFRPPSSIEINELYTQPVTAQPQGGSLEVVLVPFNAGLDEGYRYFLYDRATSESQYLARVVNPFEANVAFEWHPTGKALYYRLANDFNWFVYDVGTHEHRILGELPNGMWSRSARWRVQSFSLDFEETQKRREAEQPIPNLQIWDSETGLMRRYCVPDVFSMDGISLYWSPDDRYIAFSAFLNSDANYEISRPRTLLLDTQTGTVTELTFEIDQIVGWSE